RPLSPIRKSDVQALVKHLEGSLAPSSVGIAYSYVAAVFSEAVEDRLLASTPCVGIKTPRATTTQVTPLTVDQVQGMIQFVDDRLRALVVVAAGTGLRQGEVCGLTVDRVKFLERRIVVDRQRNPLGGSPLFAPCKTEASNRVVPLPEVVADALAQHLAKYPPGDDGLIFSTVMGGPLVRSRVGAMWDAGRRAKVVPAWSTFHDLRHFYASLLIHHGESVKVVQARLGHSTAAETLDTYAHLWPDSEDDTRRAVDRGLGSIAGQSRGKLAN
ncbi:MAG: tyrosine-type recombinase/integrase, partial [Acidimicrobiia bacterium]